MIFSLPTLYFRCDDCKYTFRFPLDSDRMSYLNFEHLCYPTTQNKKTTTLVPTRKMIYAPTEFGVKMYQEKTELFPFVGGTDNVA